jgi:hypothetical protein
MPSRKNRHFRQLNLRTLLLDIHQGSHPARLGYIGVIRTCFDNIRIVPIIGFRNR